jgi:hypothetical protein
MAKVNSVQECTKSFGGYKLVAGRYAIIDAVITKETANINNVQTEYDCLQINVAHVDANGVIQHDPSGQLVMASATLVLNGIWRPKVASDGTVMKNTGTMLDKMLQDFRGKRFDEVRSTITSTYANRQFTLAYKEYIGEYGVSTVMILNWA